jgi:DNA-binding GntR family transcriptional regulator
MSRDSVPGYQRVIDAINADIEAGRLVPGDQLPTAAVLAKQHGVGITTVRYAINILILLGVVRGQQGKGVYVRERPAAE